MKEDGLTGRQPGIVELSFYFELFVLVFFLLAPRFNFLIIVIEVGRVILLF